MPVSMFDEMVAAAGNNGCMVRVVVSRSPQVVGHGTIRWYECGKDAVVETPDATVPSSTNSNAKHAN